MSKCQNCGKRLPTFWACQICNGMDLKKVQKSYFVFGDDLNDITKTYDFDEKPIINADGNCLIHYVKICCCESSTQL